MSGLRLPQGLLDLVLARTVAASTTSSTTHARLLHAAARRHAHAATVLKPRITSSEYAPVEYDHSLYASTKARKEKDTEDRPVVSAFAHPLPTHASELELRVLELKTAASVEEVAVNSAETYSEQDLLALYDNLLALPAEPETQAQAEVDVAVQSPEPDAWEVVWATAARLELGETDGLPVRRAILARLEEVQESIDAVWTSFEKVQKREEKAEEEREPVDEAKIEARVEVPMGLMTGREWSSLIAHCVQDHDMEAAERVFELMQRSRHPIAEEQFNTVLAVYASEGDIARADAFVTKFLEAPTPRQRDLHIKCHLKNTPTLSFPTSALELVHDYEGRAMLPPQKAYSRCITRLLSARSATAHAHAWDLFAHMRYAAHPQPDAFLYTAMIRACASSALQRGGEPERALDLLAEMTGAGLALTRGAYTGAILACARSGRQEYVQEGFRLAKEMLDSHRDARGRSAFAPTRWLFCALLEGAKRIGDLARTRWILAEMVRESVVGVDGEATVDPERAIEEAAMMHVFHAYAAYKPPFKRGMAVVKESAEPAAETAPQDVDHAREVDDQPGEVVAPDGDAAFARLPPQSHAEVLYEARALFARILADIAPATAGPSVLFSTPPATRSGLFTHVQLTPRLLNAYLSVHYAHAPLEDARALFGALHGELGVSRGARAHVEALERCARADKGERGLALRFAEEAWADWLPVEARWRANKREAEEADGTDARLVERAYVALVRVYSLTTNLDRALATVRTFVAHYPPPAVRDAPPTAAIGAQRTGRTRLVGPHPLVRMFGRTEVPDDTVPPCLSFGELEALHHRLKFHGRHRDVGYVKWVCKAYEGALRRRREAVLGTRSEAKGIVKA